MSCVFVVGESSGKASKGLAKHIPGSGLQHLQGQSGSAGGEVARARQVCYLNRFICYIALFSC